MNSTKMDEVVTNIVRSRSESYFEIYNSTTVVVIGSNMEGIFEKIVDLINGMEKNSRIGVYTISEKKSDRSTVLNDYAGMDYFKYNTEEKNLYGKDFVEVLDENGLMCLDDEAEKIKEPDLKHLRFRQLISDQDFKRAAEIAASYIDSSWNVIIISDYSDKFSLDLHSTLISRIPEAFGKSTSIVFNSNNSRHLNHMEISELRNIQNGSRKYINVRTNDIITLESPLLKTNRNDIDNKIFKEFKSVLSGSKKVVS